MRLNLDCVRQILLCIEDNTGLRKSCFFIDSGMEKSQTIIGNALVPFPDYQKSLHKDFSNDELIYHINYYIEANLLSVDSPYNAYQIVIHDLTPKGHEFLENIRDNKIWSGVKDVSAKIGSKSLDTVSLIASNIITQLIRAYFHI